MVIKFLKNQRKREILLSIICGILIIVYLKIYNILFSQPHLTFIVILVALFWQSFLSFINRPILKLSFTQNSDKCFRNGMLEDNIQEFGKFRLIRQYFRLEVKNMGGGTAKKVRIIVDLYDRNGKEEERFDPECLRWITFDKEVDIAMGETTYVNLLSQVIKILDPNGYVPPPNFFGIRFELFNLSTPRAIAWDKDVEPYNIKIIVHGENIEAQTFWFQFTPKEKEIFTVGTLKKLGKKPKCIQV